jgi:hypothetical protein
MMTSYLLLFLPPGKLKESGLILGENIGGEKCKKKLILS